MKRLLPILALFGLSACAALPPLTLPKTDDTAQYEALYPYYVEMCALSEIDKKPDFGAEIVSGGPGGHSVVYLNGVCRAKDAGYPEIALCDGTPGPDEGVGISANEHFENANWVATDGRRFFFRGDLPDGAPLTRDAYAATQIAARARGIYDGVVFHDIVFDDKPDDVSKESWKYEVSAATDYAVGFARSRYCARIPVSKPQMQSVVDRLNAVNAPYRAGKRQFTWNVFHDNCSHLTHEAVAAACAISPWPQDQSLLEAAIDMPVPKNEFVDLMTRGNDMDIADPVALYRDPAATQEILQFRRLPAQPGIVADVAPVVQHNEVYDTNVHLIFYDEGIFGQYQPRFDAILIDPRYSGLAANLDYFAGVYRAADAAKRTVQDDLSRLDLDERAGFPAFYDAYYEALHAAERRLDSDRLSLE